MTPWGLPVRWWNIATSVFSSLRNPLSCS
jgi:hypothetical protein